MIAIHLVCKRELADVLGAVSRTGSRCRSALRRSRYPARFGRAAPSPLLPTAAYLAAESRDGHPLFAFTGLTPAHRRFGDQGFNVWDDGVHEGKASGWEVDTADGPGSIGLPDDSDLDPLAFPVPPSTLPSGLIVLASGERDKENGKRGADMTLHDHSGGGFVFSAGSITFGGSLVADDALRHILLNVVARAGLQTSSIWIADFTGDGKADVLFYYPGDDNWWLGSMATGQLAWSKVGNSAGFSEL